MKPRRFPITETGIAHRDAFIDALPVGEYECIVQPRDENRRSKQNRLMWLWNGQAGQEQGLSADYVHGMSKLDILLPMALADEQLHERAAFISEIMRHIIGRSKKVAVAYDMIRTKDLSVKQFAAYLTAVDRHYAEQGIVLVSPDELRNEALYQSREARAA